MRKILIAADSFKDALDARPVCEALARGFRRADPLCETYCFPLADGGEGTYDVLAQHLGLEPVVVAACDPLQRPIKAVYGLSADGYTAFIEMAKTAGLQQLTEAERNALKTNTYGTGLQIADALRRGARRLVLAIGGSATNDAGIGMAAALGWQFLDARDQPLAPTGENLINIHRIVPPVTPLPDCSVEVICDVTNPLFGPTGAAHVYARQKGADDTAIEQLDAGLRHFAAVADQLTESEAPGTGAAGGMGFGAQYFLQARLRPGIELVLDLTGFDAQLAWADQVVTGEGKIDGQTAHGKLIQGICRRAAAAGKPVIAFCGRLDAAEADIKALGLQAAYSINGPGPVRDLAAALKATAENLEQAAATYGMLREASQ